MKKFVAIALVLLINLTAVFNIAYATNSESVRKEDEIQSIAQGIINWKKSDVGSTADGKLINNKFLELAGSTPGDWYPIGLGRLGVADDYASYLAVIKDIVQNRYKESGKLSAVKSTEWHRISLAVLAMGGDPTDMGKDKDGQTINLIADGTYNRGKTASLGRQGINGWIWGLISLDSKRYAIPDNSYYSRENIIIEILKEQLGDGGFALSGDKSDADMTAMALQSLAPYYNSEKKYTYVQKFSNREITKTVRQVVDEALKCLSKLQLSDGDYASWGTENSESTCQVAVALCSLGINPQEDKRFIKNGKTLIDGILKYKMKDGGFVHSFTYDEENPTAVPNQSNTMAGEQALYTMAAIIRQMNNQRILYDFRAEQSPALKERISELEIKIASITDRTDKSTLEDLLADFYSIPENERSYVSNYWTLSDKAKKTGINIDAIAEKTKEIQSPKDENSSNNKIVFSEEDKNAVDTLPKNLTTEQYVLVVKLFDKLNQAQDFSDKNVYLEKLEIAKKNIVLIQQKIDKINSDIFEKLYPLDKMSLKDKSAIDSVVKRYNALSQYDRTKIERWDDVIKTKTKVDNQLRAVVISVVSIIVCVALGLVVINNIRKRKRAKALAMEELSAQYEDE